MNNILQNIKNLSRSLKALLSFLVGGGKGGNGIGSVITAVRGGKSGRDPAGVTAGTGSEGTEICCPAVTPLAATCRFLAAAATASGFPF